MNYKFGVMSQRNLLRKKTVSPHCAVTYYELGVLDSFIAKYYMKNEL